MKKTVRRLFSLIVVAAMIMAMSVVAFADGDGTTDDKAPTAYPVVIVNKETGHTYQAYQIFAGDLAADGTLSNITWGTGVSAEGQTKLGDAKTKAASLTSTNAAAFATEVSAYLNVVAGETSDCTDGKYTISDLAPGYYLVKDKDGSLGLGVDGKENMAYTAYILEVVKEVEVTPKSDKPTVEKKVKDINDSIADSQTGWQDSADYDINDDIPYQLKATLGDIKNYTTYNVSFIDTLSKGLTYNNDAKVYVDGVDKTSSFAFTSSTDEKTGYTTLTWTCTDVKAEAVGADSKSIITVEYTAKLNNDAIIGEAGNPNYVKLQYSNNPNGTGNGETPEDEVTVFTFKLVVNKIEKDNDGNEIPLAGAKFTLFKKGTDGTWNKISEMGNGTTDTSFTWTGLDDGDYKISETATPAGYNTIEDMTFTVTAKHDVTSDDPKLTELSGNKVTGEISIIGESTNTNNKVENKKGSILPSTGGIGTMILYVAGGALVLLGAALIVIMNVKRNRQ